MRRRPYELLPYGAKLLIIKLLARLLASALEWYLACSLALRLHCPCEGEGRTEEEVMAIDEVPRSEHIEVRQSSGPWVLVFVVLGLLVLGEVYTFTKLGSISSVQAQQATLQKQIQDSRDQLATKLSSLEDANAQQLDALRSELDTTAMRMGSGGNALARAKKLVTQLQQQTQAQNDQLKQQLSQEIAKKADTEQMNAVSQDVAATKTDLGSTKQNLDTLKNDLGMARSEMGTLIARNHEDIEALRKLGERNYYE